MADQPDEFPAASTVAQRRRSGPRAFSGRNARASPAPATGPRLVDKALVPTRPRSPSREIPKPAAREFANTSLARRAHGREPRASFESKSIRSYRPARSDAGLQSPGPGSASESRGRLEKLSASAALRLAPGLASPSCQQSVRRKLDSPLQTSSHSRARHRHADHPTPALPLLGSNRPLRLSCVRLALA